MADPAAAFDNEVRVSIYRFFVEEGRAPVAVEVADSLGTSALDVESAFRRLHDSHVIVLAPGTPYIWMANPFSALPTPFTVTVGERTYWGNCNWDALGIVAALGAPQAVVHARCPDCAEELEVRIGEGALQTRDGVVHYAVPAAHWWDDIGFN